jgi:hypothetical protein
MEERVVITLPNSVEDPDGELVYQLEEAVGRVLVRNDVPEDVEIRVEWAR